MLRPLEIIYADTPTVSLPTPTRSPAGVIYGAETCH